MIVSTVVMLVAVALLSFVVILWLGGLAAVQAVPPFMVSVTSLVWATRSRNGGKDEDDHE